MSDKGSIIAIDCRGTPIHPCWGCGKLTGGNECHTYYGNFPGGVVCAPCSDKVGKITGRAIRALEVLKPEAEAEEIEKVLKTLFDVTASTIRQISCFKDCKMIDFEVEYVRKICENEGLAAARWLIIDSIPDIEERAKEYRKVLDGPIEPPKKELTEKDKDTIRSMKHSISLAIQYDREEAEKRNKALKTMANRIIDKMQSDTLLQEDSTQEKKIIPYCTFGAELNELFRSCDSEEAFLKLLKEMAEILKGQFICLATKTVDPTYKYITHVPVEHIAFISQGVEIAQVEKIWAEGKENSVVFPLNSLTEENHWVFYEELGRRFF